MRFDNLPEPRVPHVIWIDEAPMDRRALNEWWSGLRTRPDDRTGVVFSSADSGWWGAPPDAGEVDMPTADRLKEAMEKAWASCKSTPTCALILCDDKVWRYVTLGEPFEPAMKPQRDMLTWRDRRAHLMRGRGRRHRR